VLSSAPLTPRDRFMPNAPASSSSQGQLTRILLSGFPPLKANAQEPPAAEMLPIRATSALVPIEAGLFSSFFAERSFPELLTKSQRSVSPQKDAVPRPRKSCASSPRRRFRSAASTLSSRASARVIRISPLSSSRMFPHPPPPTTPPPNRQEAGQVPLTQSVI